MAGSKSTAKAQEGSPETWETRPPSRKEPEKMADTGGTTARPVQVASNRARETAQAETQKDRGNRDKSE